MDLSFNSQVGTITGTAFYSRVRDMNSPAHCQRTRAA
jgi:hypothetical protein